MFRFIRRRCTLTTVPGAQILFRAAVFPGSSPTLLPQKSRIGADTQRRCIGTGRWGECGPLAARGAVSELSALIESVDVTGIVAVEEYTNDCR